MTSAAAQDPDYRTPVEKNNRLLVRQIANPLRLAEMRQDDTHLVLDQHWKTHFTRKSEGGVITVSQLREWIDQPKAMGLPKEVQNLLILTFAAQTNRTFYLHNTPLAPTLKDIDNRCELREQKLPQLLQRTDQILQEVGAESFAYLSDMSPTGFEQRLATLGKCLVDTLKMKKLGSIEPIHVAHEAVLNHDRAKASQERRRLKRITMAIRLMRWMVNQETTKPLRSLAEAITYHQTEGGFIDWARLSLRSGDQIRELSEAYTALFDRVTVLREQQSLQFATLLQNWVEVGSTGKTVLPVEHILEAIVAPLASHAPVLVIVKE